MSCRENTTDLELYVGFVKESILVEEMEKKLYEYMERYKDSPKFNFII